jgi:two-component system chemotaxis response regulator CheB
MESRIERDDDRGKPVVSRRDIIVIGTSRGGLAALDRVFGALPGDLPATIFVVQHLSRTHETMAAELLGAHSPLPIRRPSDGEPFQPGCIYLAPPDHHLLIDGGAMRIVFGPRENFSRPAIDPLFRSAAVAYGPRAVGVILSGTLDNGAEGLLAIARCGGVTVVQDPEDAEFAGMPESALRRLQPDHVVPLDDIGALLGRLAREPAGDPTPVPEDLGWELRQLLEYAGPAEALEDAVGPIVDHTCPGCGGPLRRIDTAARRHYRCPWATRSPSGSWGRDAWRPWRIRRGDCCGCCRSAGASWSRCWTGPTTSRAATSRHWSRSDR